MLTAGSSCVGSGWRQPFPAFNFKVKKIAVAIGNCLAATDRCTVLYLAVRHLLKGSSCQRRHL